jgi:hypothetical protein
LNITDKKLTVNAMNYVHIIDSDYKITTAQVSGEYLLAKINVNGGGNIVDIEKINAYSI